MSKRKDWHRIK